MLLFSSDVVHTFVLSSKFPSLSNASRVCVNRAKSICLVQILVLDLRWFRNYHQKPCEIEGLHGLCLDWELRIQSLYVLGNVQDKYRLLLFHPNMGYSHCLVTYCPKQSTGNQKRDHILCWIVVFVYFYLAQFFDCAMAIHVQFVSVSCLYCFWNGKWP